MSSFAVRPAARAHHLEGDGEQGLGVVGFHIDPVGAGAHRLLMDGLRRRGRQHEHREILEEQGLPQGSQELHPVQLGHVEIKNQDVRKILRKVLPRDKVKRIEPILDMLGFNITPKNAPRIVKGAIQQEYVILIVFDDQDAAIGLGASTEDNLSPILQEAARRRRAAEKALNFDYGVREMNTQGATSMTLESEDDDLFAWRWNLRPRP